MNDQTPNAPVLTPDEILVNWQMARDDLKRAINTEMYYRTLAIGTFFQNVDKTTAEGTHNYDLGNEYKLKCTFKLNYKLDGRDKVDAMLDKLTDTGEDGKFIADRIIKWAPSLSLSEYRVLSPEQKKVVDSVITVQPATPSLEIVEPKK
jgi:hypothetical protein